MPDEKVKLSPKDQALKSVARGAGIVFIGVIIGRVLGYLIRMVIARFLGPASYGLISLGIAGVEIATILALVGLPTAIGRYVSYYRAKGEESKVRGIIRSSLSISLPSGVAIGILVFFLSGYISLKIFKEPHLLPILKSFAAIVPLYTLVWVCSSIFTGFKKMEYVVGTQQILRNVLILATFITLFYLGLGVKAAIYAYLLGYLITAVIAATLSQRIFPILGSRLESSANVKKLFSFAWPLVLVSMLWFIIGRVDTLMLGYFQAAASVGVYNAALPLAQLVPIILQSFTTIFMPTISAILSTGEKQDLRSIYTTTTKWIFTLTLPLFLLLFFFSQPILSLLFGSKYVGGAVALKILSFGFLVHAAVGPTAMTLNVLEKTKLNLINTLVAFASNIILNYYLIPIYGITGAAVATAVSFILMNALSLVELHYLIALWPFNRNYLKTLLTALCSMLLVYLFRKTLLKAWTTWAFALLALLFLVFYGLLIVLSKSIEREDVAVLREIEKKLGIRLSFLKSFIEKFL